jgi:hypothetical protein
MEREGNLDEFEVGRWMLKGGVEKLAQRMYLEPSLLD